ncbi:unnamed protein product [Vitrella brassicaformis CCMP3155]|uniref:PPPDE domain-containing protein n=2 Tax=Vitrella brassicaformis TaxID=1169539 RepID=A0A0G4GCZ3_VITBC|nr:unnamed protein product [Vitrella brassicaformis CCMP3155]|eukprot:CEM26711.1 unnamed protein product [Vitrella brassicaformis CCMP3155]
MHAPDLSGDELVRLYNSPVLSVQLVSRPKHGIGNIRLPKEVMPPPSTSSEPVIINAHEAVIVTTPMGEFLIEKGSGYGSGGGNTIVKKVQHMNKAQWTFGEVRTDIAAGVTVGQLVHQGGTEYRLFSNNCQDAAGRIMEHATGSK